MLHVHEYERIRGMADAIRRMCDYGVKVHDSGTVNTHIGLRREIEDMGKQIAEEARDGGKSL